MDSFIQSFTTFFSSQSAPAIITLISFLAGILASLSPCSLGILPLIIAYVGGSENKKQSTLFVQMLSFSLGLALTMSIVGVICALGGKVLGSMTSPVFVLFIGSLLLIFGLMLLGVIDINIPNFIKKMPQNTKGGLFIYPFLIGIVFALTSSPCSTPILASVMAVASLAKSIYLSILYLFSFAFGECVIIILCALFANTIKHLRMFADKSEMLMKLSGILLILVALFIYIMIFRQFV